MAFLKKIADNVRSGELKKGGHVGLELIVDPPILPPKVDDPWLERSRKECQQLMLKAEELALFCEYESGKTPKVDLARRMNIPAGRLAVRMRKNRKKIEACVGCMNLRLSSDQRHLLRIFRSDPEVAANLPAARDESDVEKLVDGLRKTVENCVSHRMSSVPSKDKEEREGGK